ncbi:3365_t:CDS:2, partial [Dentiscutata erythropus]
VLFLKDQKTNKVTKHDIFRKTTTLPRVLEFPTFFLFTTYKQRKQTTFTENIIDNPEYAVLVTFNSINISYNTRKFTAVAQTFDTIPSYLQQKRIKQATNSMDNITLNQEDQELYINAINSIEETVILENTNYTSINTSSNSSRENSPAPPKKRVTLSPPKNDQQANNSADKQRTPVTRRDYETQNCVVPFEKEALRAFLSQYNKDKAIFRKPPNNLEDAPDHIKEWLTLLEKEITQFKDKNDINNEETLSPQLHSELRDHLRTKIMWCYLHSIDFSKNWGGRDMAQLIIYTINFILPPYKRPNKIEFNYNQFTRQCVKHFYKFKSAKHPLPEDPNSLYNETVTELPKVIFPLRNNTHLTEVLQVLHKWYDFGLLPIEYYCPKEPLPQDFINLRNEILCKTKLPIQTKEQMREINEYKQELRKFYTLPTKLPNNYIQIKEKPELPQDYNDVKEDIKKYLPWNKATVSDGISFYDILNALRKEYKIKDKLPNSYFFNHTELPEHPNQVDISDLPLNITLPITRKEDIKFLTETLRKKYIFTTNKLSKEWIDLEADNRPPLPTNMNTVNRVANINLPINKTQIVQTVKQLRQHYKFDRIPEDWILAKYTPQDELPTIDRVIIDLANKTEQTVILPITDKTKINQTVKTLHQYYNFAQLPKEFFQSNKGGYGPTHTLPHTSIINHNYNNDNDENNNIWDSDQDLSLTSLFSEFTNNSIEENEISDSIKRNQEIEEFIFNNQINTPPSITDISDYTTDIPETNDNSLTSSSELTEIQSPNLQKFIQIGTLN